MKKNTIYYNLRKSFKDENKSINNIDGNKFIFDIDKITRSLLELGINDKQKIVVLSDINVNCIKLIYSFSKIGVAITMLNEYSEDIGDSLETADYLFVDTYNFKKIEEQIIIEDYKKIINFDDKKYLDDIMVGWSDFYNYSNYYNGEILEYDNFILSYYDNQILVSLNDTDILESLNEYENKLSISNKSSVLIDDNNFILINYLLCKLNKINIGFKEDYDADIVFTTDNKLINNVEDYLVFDKIYSRFILVDKHFIDVLIDKLGSSYIRYFSFLDKLISCNENIFDENDFKIESLLNKKGVNNGETGNILIKHDKKYISTNYVGSLIDNKLEIYDFLEKEKERVKIRKTGLASIDRPWLKYYPKSSSNDKILEYTLYQNLRELNKDNYLEVALEYMGEEIKYFEMFNEIEKASKSLYALGVRKGDYVTFCMPNIPEFVYLFYAVSKIGAIACLIEPRTAASRIKDYLSESKSKVMIMVDLCKKNIDKIQDDCSLKHIVSISPVESVKDKKIKKIYNLSHKKVKSSGKYIDYKDFIKIGESILPFSENKYEKNSTATVVYTSGTTGKPKGAELTNETYNGQNMQLKYSTICPKVGEKFLGNVPFFSAYGSSAGMHNALSFGVTITLIPSYKPKDFPNLLKKYKPTHVMGVPHFFEILSESKLFNKTNLDFLRNTISGGDKMTPNREYKVNDYLLGKGTTKLKKGLGMSEFGGGFITTENDEVNKVGSVGIPHVGNNVKIIDPDTKEEVSYGREHNVGELYVSGPTQMKGYLNNEQETNNFFEIDKNGVRWAKTGDLVYMDEDGVIFFIDRLKNVIMRPDGHTVPLLPIENAIDKSDNVDSCAVVGASVDDKETGKLPMAFIVLKKDITDSMDDIYKELKHLNDIYIPEREQAYWYRFVDALPYNLAGKVDVKKLENIANNDKNKTTVLVDLRDNKNS